MTIQNDVREAYIDKLERTIVALRRNATLSDGPQPGFAFCPRCLDDTLILRRLGNTFICEICKAEWYE
jgi:hypothetical protein